MGVVIGAFIGLLVGDSWTAVWLGVLAACISAWIASLNWQKFANYSRVLAEKIDVSGSGTAVWNTGISCAKEIKSCVTTCGKVILCAISAGQCRFVLSAVFLLAITILSFELYLSVFGVWDDDETSLLRLAVEFVWILSVVIALPIVLMMFIISFVIAYETVKEIATHSAEAPGGIYNFFFGWSHQFLDSEHSTNLAFFEMFGIRFWNALKILFYCLVVWPIWLFVAIFALANTKTRTSALCASLLSFAHLGGSHSLLGGIDSANPNFWLSLVCVAIAGYYLGGKIAQTDFAKRKREIKFPLPSQMIQS
ncbi:MAG: hypothetical protein Q7R65_04430 [bacterium]|nr:hypothetical protein [bacterium]